MKKTMKNNSVVLLMAAMLMMPGFCFGFEDSFSYEDGYPAEEYDFDFTLSEKNMGVERYAIAKRANKEGQVKLVIPDSVKAYAWDEKGMYQAKNYPVREINEYFIGYALKGNLQSVTLGKNVEKIGKEAFSGCEVLSDVTLPAALNTIEDCAFRGNKSLKQVTLPDGLSVIGRLAFCECDIQQLTFPSSLSRIGDGAFSGNKALKEIVIPATIREMGCNPFDECTSLSSIRVEEANPYYDSREGCNAIIEKETKCLVTGCNNTFIPQSVEIIGDCACTGVSFQKLVLHQGVKEIGRYAFQNCKEIAELSLPNTLNTIGDRAFQGCEKMESLKIPASVEEMGEASFDYCRNLSTIIVEEGNTHYDSREGCNAIIEKKRNRMFTGSSRTIIPDDVQYLSSAAFHGNRELSSITIPASVKRIDSSAFLECPNLKDVIVLSSDPIELAANTFDSEYDGEHQHYVIDITLHVPFQEGVRDRYVKAPYWGQFKQIAPDADNPNNVKDALAEKTTSSAPIFDLQGRRLQQTPQRGLYIQGGKKYLVK